jgi:hypothetical protein
MQAIPLNLQWCPRAACRWGVPMPSMVEKAEMRALVLEVRLSTTQFAVIVLAWQAPPTDALRTGLCRTAGEGQGR